jgi:hypothetical protein
MKDKQHIKSKRKELLEMIIQILKEQFSNINPNKEKINRYLDERFVNNSLN